MLFSALELELWSGACLFDNSLKVEYFGNPRAQLARVVACWCFEMNDVYIYVAI